MIFVLAHSVESLLSHVMFHEVHYELWEVFLNKFVRISAVRLRVQWKRAFEADEIL